MGELEYAREQATLDDLDDEHSEETMRSDDMMQRATELQPEAIQDEYKDLPGTMAYWTGQYASALEAALDAKAAMEQTEAALFIEHRDRLELEGVKLTERLIDAHVQKDARMVKARRAYGKAEGEKHRVHGVVESVRAKKEALISLGADLRSERGSDISVRDGRAPSAFKKR